MHDCKYPDTALVKEESHNIHLESTLLRLPQEVKDRILHFLGSRYRLYLGYRLDAWETFLDDGIFIILKTILDDGADLKALLFMKKNYFANADVTVKRLIIHYAVKTKSIAVVKRVCCLWPEVRFLDEGWIVSEHNHFLWGMRNLGSGKIRARSSWVYVYKLKDYTHIPKLLKKGTWPVRLLYELDVPPATVATYVRETFEELYKFSESLYTHERKKIRDTIKFYNGERDDYLERLRIHLCVPEDLGLRYAYEYQFIAGGERMYKLICEFAQEDIHFLDRCIAIYNTVTASEEQTRKSNTYYLVAKMVVHGKKELLPVLAKIDGVQPILSQALKIKSAVNTKDEVALRELFPVTNREAYAVGSSWEALNYFDLFFFIMFFYDFVADLREHFAERNEGYRAFIVPVTLNPDILIERILQDISLEDEEYTRSIYGLKHLGFHLNSRITIDMAFDSYDGYLNYSDEEVYSPHNVLDRWQTYLSSDLKIQETIPPRALYDYYRTDPSFRLSDTDHLIDWYKAPGQREWWEPNHQLPELKWFLYRILKEKIPFTDVKEGEDITWNGFWTQKSENIISNAIVRSMIAVDKSPTTGRVTAVWLTAHTNSWDYKDDLHSLSIVHAWGELIGKDVPNIAF